MGGKGVVVWMLAINCDCAGKLTMKTTKTDAGSGCLWLGSVLLMAIILAIAILTAPKVQGQINGGFGPVQAGGLALDTNGVVQFPTNFFVVNLTQMLAALGTNIGSGGISGTNYVLSADFIATNTLVQNAISNLNLALIAGLSSNGVAFLTAMTNGFGATPTPTVSLAPGTYYVGQSVSLASSLSNATVYYTTDFSTPTTSSAVYSTAIPISSTRTIKAMAVAPYHTASGVLTATYTIGTGATVYWGHSQSSVLTSGTVTGLENNVYTGVPDGNYAFTAASGYYYFAWPVSFIQSTPPVASTGFYIRDGAGNSIPLTMAGSGLGYGTSTDGAGWSYATVTITTIPYAVYRSAYPLTGADTVKVTSAAIP